MDQHSWYTSKRAIFFYHLLFWVATLFLPHLIRPILEQSPNPSFDKFAIHYSRGNAGFQKLPIGTYDSLQGNVSARKQPPPHRPNGHLFTSVALGLNIVWICLFYLNTYFLIPELIYRRRIPSYIILQVSVFIIVIFCSVLLLYWVGPQPNFRLPVPLILNIFPFLFVQASGLAYRMVMDKITTDKLLKDKENEGLKTELSFLRSQISPHFVFNVLNNMVSLARKQSGQLEPSLIKLSGIMRYMLYESDEMKVMLTREIEYLQSYIDLQALRFGKEINIVVDIQIPDKNYFIEPMLLIPFVENAFKHCNASAIQPLIEISFKVTNGVLSLLVRNNFDPSAKGENDYTSGIGLANVKRRLKLLYRDNHSLFISERNDTYAVSLQITLE
ncbi:sensor histidine kinase [Flavihumibacter profundi]|uniref:sensor histidine kinase n=1 Tax=Flavihumibacter profundi TaxID=2716883 RepID=UPI001CC43481|nr:histidine kinase [Flavihumibacter profundi]MBZ5855633.1 histidine kinase [Flavihumibacter profundi]